MVTTSSSAPGAMTGKRYIESLRDGREVWLDGKRVEDVTTHPAFRDMVKSLADVYDLQNSDEYRDQMTYVDPESGVRTSLSWLIPNVIRGLGAQAAQQPALEQAHLGPAGPQPGHPGAVHLQHGAATRRVRRLQDTRTATSARTSSTTTATAATTTSSSPTPSATRRSTAAHSRRTSAAQTPEDEEIALHVVEETDAGVIVSGGKQLSTAAVHSNETYVSLSATFFARNDPRFVLAFSIPTNSKGLKILAASPWGAGSAPGATPSWRWTSRTACSSSSACSCPGTASSSSTNRRRASSPSRGPAAPTPTSPAGPTWSARSSASA